MNREFCSECGEEGHSWCEELMENGWVRKYRLNAEELANHRRLNPDYWRTQDTWTKKAGRVFWTLVFSAWRWIDRRFSKYYDYSAEFIDKKNKK